MRDKSQDAIYEDLEREFGGLLARAFLEVIHDLRRSPDLEAIIALFARGDIEGALAAMGIEAAAYTPFAEAMRAAFIASGQSGAATLAAAAQAAQAGGVAGALGAAAGSGLGQALASSAGRLIFRFDGRARSAEAWLSRYSGEFITRTIEGQREAIRAALLAALERGDNPRSAIPAIIGRYDAKTRTRVGGIIGLTGPQAQWVQNAWLELISGRPQDLEAFLDRQARDKTYDKAIRRAIASGKPLPADVARKALAGYQSGLLRVRAEAVAQTETLTSLNAGRFAAYQQAVDNGQIDPLAAEKIWRDSRDGRVRHSHAILNGQRVPLLSPFISPTGARMMFPGDTSLGAKAGDVVLCRCRFEVRINRFANLT